MKFFEIRKDGKSENPIEAYNLILNKPEALSIISSLSNQMSQDIVTGQNSNQYSMVINLPPLPKEVKPKEVNKKDESK